MQNNDDSRRCLGMLIRSGRELALSLVAIALSGCAASNVHTDPARVADGATPAQQAAQSALRKSVVLQTRLYKISSPLLIENADLCKTQARKLLGFTAQNKYSYPGQYADAAQSELSYGERLVVSVVLSGSGAARAGLRPGDVLLTVNGKTLPAGANADTEAGKIFGPLLASRTTLNLQISRDKKALVLDLPATRACAYQIVSGNADNINTYADGQRIVVTRGMMNFAANDEEIAYVVARAMADNILGHAAAQHQGAALGALVDNLTNVQPDLSKLTSPSIRPMSADMDASADRLSLFLLARAGYDLDGAARFWQRLATRYPAAVVDGYTADHPDTANRLLSLNKTAAIIHAKQRAGLPLIP